MSRPFISHIITDDSALGGKEIERSLVFNSASGSHLTRTPSSAGNRKKWTFSCWIKRSELGGSGFNAGEQRIFGGDANASHIFFSSGETIRWDLSPESSGSASATLTTNRLMRDHINWFHLVCALDTDESTADNRMRMYINGVEETSFDTRNNPSSGLSNNAINAASLHTIGRRTSAQGSDGMKFDGYIAEINFIDGQQYDASYFGYTEPQTGIWRPKRYEGAYGQNGFHLDFSDTTSTTTIGHDKSGNGNHFTLNDLGTEDALLDTPTNNFATLVMQGTGFSSGAGYNEGNRKFTTGSSGSARNLDRQATSSYTFNKGKWYAEFRCDAGNAGNKFLGVGPWQLMINPESNNNRYVYIYSSDGHKYVNTNGSESNTDHAASFTNGDIIGIFIDMDASTPVVYFSKNGQWANGTNAWNQANPTSGIELGNSFFTQDIDRNLIGYCGFILSSGSGGLSMVYVANFGQDSTFAGSTTAGGFKDSTGIGDFKYAVPSGALALCSKNLIRLNKERGTECKIINAKRHFDVLTYTGDGQSGRKVSGLQFRPDFLWIKRRDSGANHGLYDVVRGHLQRLVTDTENVEDTNLPHLESFDGDGFTLGSDTYQNGNGQTFVAWAWKAGGAAVTNNDGTIATSISANQEAGFSIVTWSGNGSAGATLGHGLGKKPKMIIVKRRAGGNQDWFMDVGEIENARGGRYWRLRGAISPQSDTNVFPATAPTSTVFSVGADAGVNASGSTYVAYVWTDIPGYSAFGTYRGNGDTDGQYVTTGFKPRFILTKRSAVDGWSMWDSQRSGGHNLIHNRNGAGYSDAESTAISSGTSLVDMYGNGFKWRGQSNDTNGDGDNYVYMCFGEESFNTPYFAVPTAR